MENNQKGVQVNPNYVIDELMSKNVELTMENAKLKALLREQAEQENTKEAE